MLPAMLALRAICLCFLIAVAACAQRGDNYGTAEYNSCRERIEAYREIRAGGPVDHTPFFEQDNSTCLVVASQRPRGGRMSDQDFALMMYGLNLYNQSSQPQTGTTSQTYFTPSGKMVTCTTSGQMTSCF